MSIHELGKRSAVARADTSGHSGPNPTALRAKVESLGVTVHKGTKIRFTYHSDVTRSTILVSGQFEKITRGAPGQPTILKVDRLFYAVPAGTLVTIEAGEIR